MTSKIANLVQQTSTGTGSGNLTLIAPTQGYKTFASAFGTGATTNTFYYFISNPDAVEWEIGTGHMSDATTLVRDTVLESSNANNLVTFTAGTKNIVNDLPASFQSKLEYLNIASNASWNSIVTEGSYITSGTTYTDAPLFDLFEHTGILKVFRNSDTSAYITQEWINGLTGDIWKRHSSSSGTNWTMWKPIDDFSRLNSYFLTYDTFAITNSVLTSTGLLACGLLFSSSNSARCAFQSLPTSYLGTVSSLAILYTYTSTNANASIIPQQMQSVSSLSITVKGGIRFEGLVSLPVTASDGTNTYEVIFGGNVSSIAGTRLTYNYNVNGGRWTATCQDSSTTSVDTGVSPVFGCTDASSAVTNAQILRIEEDYGSKRVRFYINDVLVATITTNISFRFYPRIAIVKSAGTNARYLACAINNIFVNVSS